MLFSGDERSERGTALADLACTLSVFGFGLGMLINIGGATNSNISTLSSAFSQGQNLQMLSFKPNANPSYGGGSEGTLGWNEEVQGNGGNNDDCWLSCGGTRP